MTTNSEWLWTMGRENPDKLAEWLKAEHANDGNGSGQSNIEWLLSRSGIYRDADYCAFDNMVVKAAEECDLMPDGLKPFWRKHDWLLAPHENCAQDADQRERENMDGCESDSREKLEADVRRAAEEMERFSFGERFINTNLILRWLDRQAAITRKTEQAAWIQQANGLIHEANAERDELKSYVEDATADYAKLVKERDELKAKVHDLQIVVDCVDERNKRYCELVSERDNLARDLQDCNREREKWRDLCGRMQDASHEVGRIADEGMA